MAISGTKFLALTGARSLRVTPHALERIRQRAGVSLAPAQALDVFGRARHIRCPELRLLGYDPNFLGRRQRGVQSHYFRTELNGRQLIAVLTEDRFGGDPVWVTTCAQSA